DATCACCQRVPRLMGRITFSWRRDQQALKGPSLGFELHLMVPEWHSKRCIKGKASPHGGFLTVLPSNPDFAPRLAPLFREAAIDCGRLSLPRYYHRFNQSFLRPNPAEVKY